jgi:hypothetical protein
MNAEALHLSLRSVGGVLRSWGASLNRQVAARPGTAAVVITGTKACAADALVQCVEDRGWWGSASLPWDWRRTALFTIFGAGYQGGAQYLVFNRVLVGSSSRSPANPCPTQTPTTAVPSHSCVSHHLAESYW